MNFDVQFLNIEERDTDIAIIRSFIDYKEVRKLFFSLIGKEGEIIKIFHSKRQFEKDNKIGESDIIIILENDNERFAIFIEDKINANPQPNQRKRYDERAQLLKVEECLDEYYIFLCAPKVYLSTAKAEGYEYTISHEAIGEKLNENDLNKVIFQYSCDDKKQGYNPIEDVNVTDFWNKLYEYIDKNYELNIKRQEGPRGSNAVWAIFNTKIEGIKVCWKSDKNVIDINFDYSKCEESLFYAYSNKFKELGCYPVTTGKSRSLRISIPRNMTVNFREDFNEQIKEITYVLNLIDEIGKISVPLV